MSDFQLFVQAGIKLASIWGPIVVPAVIGVGLYQLREELRNWRV